MPTLKSSKPAGPVTENQGAGAAKCYHCGAKCAARSITYQDKAFCCQGCKLVYELLQSNNLCDYYKLEAHPGLAQIKPLRANRFEFLDNDEVAARLYKFTDGTNTIAELFIPGVHCSSCLWLLEHLQKLNTGIQSSRLNFSTKELTVHFNKKAISLRQLVELLTTIGYEPHISLSTGTDKPKAAFNKARIIKLGIAGFCFGNIMLLSFPEYLGNFTIEPEYALLFRLLNLILALPVFFYCSSEFYVSAWKGLKQKMLNIDAPIVLALLITFCRSVYEIATGTGAGYLDSMSGVVFFMLIGRVVQERTYGAINFHRNYKSYFPIAVSVQTPAGFTSRNIEDLEQNDIVKLYGEEIIPADGILLEGRGKIDYSFVSGESEPVYAGQGDTLYAGGRQLGDSVLMQVTRPVKSSYLTQLWNHHAFKNKKQEKNERESAVHILSKNFTYVLFTLALITALYWWYKAPANIIPSVTAMLIVACPCALLLAATYTNGNMLRVLSNNGLFLRDASIIEELGKINHIAFDKTGTLMHTTQQAIPLKPLPAPVQDVIYSLAMHSRHPYSMAIAATLAGATPVPLTNWHEIPGKGIRAEYNGMQVMLGSANFVNSEPLPNSQVYALVNNHVYGFNIMPAVRPGVNSMVQGLQPRYNFTVLSGDNVRHKEIIAGIFNSAPVNMLFNQQPIDKLQYVETLQENGKRVLMVGDGLNDAGALQQSNVGITLVDDVNNFTPGCDAILDAAEFSRLPAFLQLSRYATKIVRLSFIISIVYNLAGLWFAMRAQLNPMIAAILMPASTLTIVLLTSGLSSLCARRLGLRLSSRR